MVFLGVTNVASAGSTSISNSIHVETHSGSNNMEQENITTGDASASVHIRTEANDRTHSVHISTSTKGDAAIDVSHDVQHDGKSININKDYEISSHTPTHDLDMSRTTSTPQPFFEHALPLDSGEYTRATHSNTSSTAPKNALTNLINMIHYVQYIFSK